MEKREDDIRYFQELLEQHDYRKLRDELSNYNEVDVAFFIDELPEYEAAVVFRMLPKEFGAEVFSHLSSDAQQELASAFSDQEVSDMLERLFVDDAVDFLEEMPANVVKRVLQQTRPDRRAIINHYLQYPEDSAGSIMTSEYTDLKQHMTVREAIEHLRKSGEDRETIYTCYVTNRRRVLEGVVSVRALLLADDDDIVSDLMETDVITAHTTDDQEDVARLFHKYDYLAIPIVDNERRLVGIVTVDDAVDIIQEEATEDFEKMAAMTPSEKPYLKMSVWEHAKKRVIWLFVLMVSGMITGNIMGHYEASIQMLPLLVTFVPMLTDTGGNAGAQSSTMLIRGMALNEIELKDIFKVIWKEMRISLICGSLLAGANFLRIYLQYNHDVTIALTVSVALVATVFMAKLTGGILPLLAKAIHLDPAIMAAPLITTVVDAASLIIYFNLASAILHRSVHAIA